MGLPVSEESTEIFKLDFVGLQVSAHRREEAARKKERVVLCTSVSSIDLCDVEVGISQKKGKKNTHIYISIFLDPYCWDLGFYPNIFCYLLNLNKIFVGRLFIF